MGPWLGPEAGGRVRRVCRVERVWCGMWPCRWNCGSHGAGPGNSRSVESSRGPVGIRGQSGVSFPVVFKLHTPVLYGGKIGDKLCACVGRAVFLASQLLAICQHRWGRVGGAASQGACHSVVSNSLLPSGPTGSLQVRILEWAAIPFSRGSSQASDGNLHCRRVLYQVTWKVFGGAQRGLWGGWWG